VKRLGEIKDKENRKRERERERERDEMERGSKNQICSPWLMRASPTRWKQDSGELSLIVVV